MFCIGAATSVSAGTQDLQKEVRALYQQTNKLIAAGIVHEILVHTGPPSYGRSSPSAQVIWRRVTNPRERKDFDESDYKARVYVLNGKVVKAVILIISEGWNDTIEHYFYNDGNVAFVFERLSTLHGYDTEKHVSLPPGPYIVERRTYFENDGQIGLEKSTSFFESSKQPIPLSYVRTSVMMYGSYYLSSQSLPFYSVVPTKR